MGIEVRGEGCCGSGLQPATDRPRRSAARSALRASARRRPARSPLAPPGRPVGRAPTAVRGRFIVG